MTRNEIEQQRALLKVYFPNQSSERAMFNTLCDMAVKHLKCVPPEGGASLQSKDAERVCAIAWRVKSATKYGAADHAIDAAMSGPQNSSEGGG